MNPVQLTWYRQVQTEYASAALAAQMCHWMVVLGMSPDTLVRATRLITDELRHSEQCRTLYLSAGGDPDKIEIDARNLWIKDDPEAPLVTRLISAVGALAVEESLALAVFQRRLENATDPEAREVMRSIVKDEAFHSAFAWDALDELAEILGRERLRAQIRPRIAWWLRNYTNKPSANEPVFPPDALAFGLIDRHEHWAILQACAKDVILARLVQRELLEPDATLPGVVAELAVADGRPQPPWQAEP